MSGPVVLRLFGRKFLLALFGVVEKGDEIRFGVMWQGLIGSFFKNA